MLGWRLPPLPFAGLPVVASDPAFDHFVAPFVACPNECDEKPAAEAKRAEAHYDDELRQLTHCPASMRIGSGKREPYKKAPQLTCAELNGALMRKEEEEPSRVTWETFIIRPRFVAPSGVVPVICSGHEVAHQQGRPSDRAGGPQAFGMTAIDRVRKSKAAHSSLFAVYPMLDVEDQQHLRVSRQMACWPTREYHQKPGDEREAESCSSNIDRWRRQ